MREAGAEVVLPTRFGPLDAAEMLKILPGVDAVLASLDQYPAAVVASPEAGQLKIISRWGVGYDAIDLEAATQNGIVITYTPGLLDEAVADYTVALLLSLARRIPESHAAMAAGGWKRNWGHDIFGQTLGIFGLGRIGLAVARRAAGFNMRVLACSRSPKPEAVKLGVRFVPLDELLAESDFVTLHASLNPGNRGAIGEPQLRRMKPAAFLVNTARGQLVDEAALARALREGWIAGAALDVFGEEPLPAAHPLRSAPNLVLSPHQASFAQETGERVSQAAAEAIIDLMSGRRPRQVLNPDVFQSPALRARVEER